uniref:Ig-like domain-containing protein n=1 Tax=Hippocampus comes TaxID=109280 RepID=A0A3Q2XD45_HIPCM
MLRRELLDARKALRSVTDSTSGSRSKKHQDSEATEDETTEPQMEPKGGLGRHQDKTARGGPLGEGDRMMENNPDASDRRGTLPGSYDPVVERELRTLGSRPAGPNMDPTNTSRKRTQKSPNTLVITSAEHQSPSSKENDRFPSPTGKHESPVTVRGSESQYPTKPPRLSPSPTPSISPLLKRRKEEKVVIPTILVEDETKTECDAGQMRTNEVKSGAAEEQSGRLDEEHLSPQACVMELHGCASASTKSVHFKEPPSFQVGPCDQAVIEGQDVVISVKVTGQPKPLIYWLKDKVPVKTAGRFSMREMEDGANEIRIISAQRSDSGLYACKLVNERGTKQEECSVEVKSEQSKVRVDGYVTNLSLYMSRCTCLRLRNMYLIISCSTDAPENYPRDQRADGGGRRVGHV